MTVLPVDIAPTGNWGQGGGRTPSNASPLVSTDTGTGEASARHLVLLGKPEVSLAVHQCG